jgi:hypothetical protein
LPDGAPAYSLDAWPTSAKTGHPGTIWQSANGRLPMYSLYNVKRWGSLAPHLVLEELEVPYQNIWMTPEKVLAGC